MTRVHRFNRLPHLKSWLPLTIFGLILALVAGLVGNNANLLNSEFGVNQSLNAAGSGALNTVAKLASDVYSPKFAVILTAVVMLLIWLFGKSRLDALGFGATVAMGWLPAEAFKIMFNEPRANISGLVNQVLHHEVDSSFPSGHVCFALGFGFALYFLARNSRFRVAALVFWIVSVLVEAWARLYVGAHYLSDEVGSLFTTTVGILVLSYLWNKWISQKLQSYKFFA
jgi:membrane-associated phospholipid phosphatase